MKTMKMTLAAVAMFITTMTMQAQPMSYYAMRENARFLTDRMAYTLGIATSLLDDLYMINYDYICGVNDYLDDVAYGYHYDDYMAVLYARDAALRRLLSPYQWSRLMTYDYFYRPISFVNRRWSFSIYAWRPLLPRNGTGRWTHRSARRRRSRLPHRWRTAQPSAARLRLALRQPWQHGRRPCRTTQRRKQPRCRWRRNERLQRQPQCRHRRCCTPRRNHFARPRKPSLQHTSGRRKHGHRNARSNPSGVCTHTGRHTQRRSPERHAQPECHPQCSAPKRSTQPECHP